MTDQEVLRWMGLMGHLFAVTREDRDGNRSSHGECNDIKTALKWAGEVKNGAAYQRTKKGWKLVGTAQKTAA